MHVPLLEDESGSHLHISIISSHIAYPARVYIVSSLDHKCALTGRYQLQPHWGTCVTVMYNHTQIGVVAESWSHSTGHFCDDTCLHTMLF